MKLSTAQHTIAQHITIGKVCPGIFVTPNVQPASHQGVHSLSHPAGRLEHSETFLTAMHFGRKNLHWIYFEQVLTLLNKIKNTSFTCE